jgi:hypothetical protein
MFLTLTMNRRAVSVVCQTRLTTWRVSRGQPWHPWRGTLAPETARRVATVRNDDLVHAALGLALSAAVAARLRNNCNLHVVGNDSGVLATCCHRACIRIGQRDLLVLALHHLRVDRVGTNDLPP